MKKTDFNKDWDFIWGEPPKIPMMPVQKKRVDLPYDFIIGTDVAKDAAGGAATGYYKGGTGSYTKYYEVTEENYTRGAVRTYRGRALAIVKKQ